MDCNRALHGDGDIFVVGKKGECVLRAYVERRKASRREHAQTLLQSRAHRLILRRLQLLAYRTNPWMRHISSLPQQGTRSPGNSRVRCRGQKAAADKC